MRIDIQFSLSCKYVYVDHPLDNVLCNVQEFSEEGEERAQSHPQPSLREPPPIRQPLS